MTDLTEQWKKGELHSGWYYVQLQEGVYVDGKKSIIMDYYTEFCDFMKHPYLIEEVLAPVPSYEEFLSLTYAKEEDEKIIAEYEQENDKLKEVLHIIKRQCELLMPKNGLNPVGDRAVMKMFLTKIDEVLK